MKKVFLSKGEIKINLHELNMITLLYDGSFDGLLTAVFEVFEYRYSAVEIVNRAHFQEKIFSTEIHDVITQKEKSERVLKKLESNLGKSGIQQLIMVYLSEDAALEHLILSAIQQSIKNPNLNILQNYADNAILKISKICKSVSRERHRMTAFVRFEKMKDEVYFAKIDPDYNVLPLIRNHFKNRYQDQQWIIYDLRRNYGLFYNLKDCDFIYPEEKFKLNNYSENFSQEETKYQQLWQRYFTKTNIVERKNTKLHMQHVPKRYWKYLTEKW